MEPNVDSNPSAVYETMLATELIRAREGRFCPMDRAAKPARSTLLWRQQPGSWSW